MSPEHLTPARIHPRASPIGAFAVALITAISQPAAFAARPLDLEPAATLSLPDSPYRTVGSVAIDGDDMVVGVTSPNLDIGALWYRRQSNGTWSYVANLLPIANVADQRMSVAIRGNVIAIHYTGPSKSELAIFERSSTGWQRSPVQVSLSSAIPVYFADVAISGTTVLLGGGPRPGAASCDTHFLRALRKNASGSWVVVDTVSSDPRVEISPSPAGCLEDIDVDISGSSAILSAIGLAEPFDPSAAYLFSGFPGSSTTSTRVTGFQHPVALENDTALLSGAHVFQRSGGAWTFRQILTRPDRLMLGRSITSQPVTAKLRNGYALVGYVDAISVYRRGTDPDFSEVARLRLRGSDFPPEDSEEPPDTPPWYPTSIDIANRRIVANDVFSANVYVFELPATISVPEPVQDTFEDGNSAGWTPLAGSSWSVPNTAFSKVYRQSSTAGDAGSFFGNTDWTNQSIEADIRATAFNGNDRWFGLVVRRADPQNYYYLTVRSSNSYQLRKRVNGVFQPIATINLSVSLNQNYRVRLEAIGATISAYVNDLLILRTVDTSHTHGQAGLQMYRTAADYDNVVVTPNARLLLVENSFEHEIPPVWTPIQSGNWSVEEGRWYVQSSTQGDAGSVTGISTDDQAIEAFIVPTLFDGNDRWFGLMARYQDQNNYYYVTLRSSNRIALRRLVNGVIRELATAPLAVNTGGNYRVRLEAIQNQLRVYVNGELALNATDGTFERGRYGLRTYKTAARFTEVRAFQP